MNLKGNDFLKLLDYTPEQIDYLLRLAAQLKAEKKAGIPHRLCEGKNVALIFEKTSTRTRSSFEVAAHDLGMGSTYLDSTGSQIGKKESIADTARVLGALGIQIGGSHPQVVSRHLKGTAGSGAGFLKNQGYIFSSEGIHRNSLLLLGLQLCSQIQKFLDLLRGKIHQCQKASAF